MIAAPYNIKFFNDKFFALLFTVMCQFFFIESIGAEQDIYSKELEKMVQLEREFENLIIEARSILQRQSTLAKVENSDVAKPCQLGTEIKNQTVFEDKQKLAISKPMSISSPSLNQSSDLFVKETSWSPFVYQNSPNSNCTEVESCLTPCNSNFSLSKSCNNNYCGYTNDFFIYGDCYLGERPCFDGSMYTAGVMFFEDSLRKSGVTLFTDLSWSSFQDHDNGVTAGIGVRWTFPCSKSILGLNTYFDYLDFSKSSFRQTSVGFEWITCDYSLRANGYFPVGKKRSCSNHIIYDDYIGEYFVEVDSWYKALQGYDIEFRKCFCLPCALKIYPAIGGYYLTGDCFGTLGAKGSLGIEWNNFVSAEGVVYYDRCNKTKGEAKISVMLPFEMICNPRCEKSCDRTRVRVRRKNYISNKQICEYTTNY